jgi:hypothetical protein
MTKQKGAKYVNLSKETYSTSITQKKKKNGFSHSLSEVERLPPQEL